MCWYSSGGVLSCMCYIAILAVLIRNRVSVLAILAINREWFLRYSLELDWFSEEAIFESLSMSSLPIHDAFNIDLKSGTSYREGLKQSIDWRVRSSTGYRRNRVGKIRDFTSNRIRVWDADQRPLPNISGSTPRIITTLSDVLVKKAPGIDD